MKLLRIHHFAPSVSPARPSPRQPSINTASAAPMSTSAESKFTRGFLPLQSGAIYQSSCPPGMSKGRRLIHIWCGCGGFTSRRTTVNVTRPRPILSTRSRPFPILRSHVLLHNPRRCHRSHLQLFGDDLNANPDYVLSMSTCIKVRLAPGTLQGLS